jgi:hypothetical protein
MARSLPKGVRPAFLLFLVLLPAGGCGGDSSVVRVTGTIRHDGKPVANLFLTFVPESGRSSWGVTDEEGHYKLSYDRKHEGAVRGMHRIYVQFRPRDPQQEMALKQGKQTLPPDVEAILAKYGNPDSTPLRREIDRDGQVIDLDLD